MQLAAVELEKVPGDCKPKSRTACPRATLVYLIETLENSGRLGGIHPDPGIRHLDLDSTSLTEGAKRNHTFGRCEFNRVVKQIHYNLFDAPRIGTDFRQGV